MLRKSDLIYEYLLQLVLRYHMVRSKQTPDHCFQEDQGLVLTTTPDIWPQVQKQFQKIENDFRLDFRFVLSDFFFLSCFVSNTVCHLINMCEGGKKNPTGHTVL